MATRVPESNPDHFGGARVRTKQRSIVAKAGQYTEVVFVLEDDNGNAVDLTAFGFGVSESEDTETPSIVVRIQESAQSALALTTGIVRDATAGEVQFVVPDEINQRSGIWLAEIIVQQGDLNVFSNTAYLVIERTGGQTCGGLPTMAELRMFLRDYAAENEFLDAVDFDVSELALAADLCVQEWNESPPLNTTRYNTQTFPFRRMWMVGISGHLFNTAAEHYARNSYTYQAGGVAADDKSKFQLYAQRAQLARQEWRQLLRERKAIQSMDEGFGEVGGYWSP